MASKDTIGGWRENAHIYKSQKACSTIKQFFGNSWSPIMDGIRNYNASCTLPMDGVEVFNKLKKKNIFNIKPSSLKIL